MGKLEVLIGLADLAQWSNLGPIVFLPSPPTEVPQFLIKLRRILGKPESNRGILAGSDQSRPARSSLPLPALMLQRMFEGAGRETAAKVAAHFENDWGLMMTAPVEEWKEAGAHKGIRKQLEELRGT